MDSRVKRTVVFLSIFLILVVLVIVGAANYKTLAKKINPNLTSSTSATEVTVANPGKTLTSGSLQLGNDLDAWKSDETFFDSEATTLAARLMEEMSTLTVKCVSIQNDLRIRILDYNQKLKEGIEFEIKLKSEDEVKTYKDKNMDGVIYIDELKPGSYELSLMEVKDLIVPDKPLEIMVCDRVNYTYIEDIELLFKEKSEAETAIDDLMTVGALSYADKKQATKIGSDYTKAYGIDLSEINGEVNFEKLYAAGVRFVMLRAGYRGAITGDIVIDKKFKDYAHAAIKAGLNVGAFFLSQAINEYEAVEEASAIIKACEDVVITYPVVIRVDTAGGVGRADGIDSDTRTIVAEAFCETVKASGYDPCVYASSNWLVTNLDNTKLLKYKTWMAEFKSKPSYDEYYDMWQYSSKGKVSGVDGEVYLTVSYFD